MFVLQQTVIKLEEKEIV